MENSRNCFEGQIAQVRRSRGIGDEIAYIARTVAWRIYDFNDLHAGPVRSDECL